MGQSALISTNILADGATAGNGGSNAFNNIVFVVGPPWCEIVLRQRMRNDLIYFNPD